MLDKQTDLDWALHEPYENDAYYSALHRPTWRRKLTPWLLGGLAVAGWITAVVFAFLWEQKIHESHPLPSKPISESWDARFQHAAVAADNYRCSEIGRDILAKGGNAVDSILAGLICDGVQNAHSMGLGGGFFMTIFNQSTKKCKTINARETAPRNAPTSAAEALTGWQSIGVPGELAGYWEASRRWGKLPWADLWQPTIDMAEQGYYISKGLAKAMHHKWIVDRLKNESTLKMYIDPTSGEPYPVGSQLRDSKLASTMRQIQRSSDPVQLFYNGRMGDQLVREIRENGGIMEKEDLSGYKVVIKDGWEVVLDETTNLRICTLAAPSGGPGTAMYLTLIKKLIKTPPKSWDEWVEAYHKMIEATKLAYSHWKFIEDPTNEQEKQKIDQLLREMTSSAYIDKVIEKMGQHPMKETSDYEWNPAEGKAGKDDPYQYRGGTAHISVVDQQGNAASATSSINYYFGSLKRSRTGIVWNNHLADFDFSERAKFNSYKAGRRPRSSMAPVIITKDDSPYFVSGASGGSKIMGAIGYVVGRVLYLNETLKEATDAARLFTRGEDKIQVEDFFDKELKHRLTQRHHRFIKWSGRSVVQSILADDKNDQLLAQSDVRKHGVPAGY